VIGKPVEHVLVVLVFVMNRSFGRREGFVRLQDIIMDPTTIRKRHQYLSEYKLGEYPLAEGKRGVK
jgi:hypothetical protein